MSNIAISKIKIVISITFMFLLNSRLLKFATILVLIIVLYYFKVQRINTINFDYFKVFDIQFQSFYTLPSRLLKYNDFVEIKYSHFNFNY